MAKTWPAPELDGWTYAHNTIRLDEQDLLDSVARMNETVLAGEHVEDFEIQALKTHWSICFGFIKEHHHNEEEHIFPAIQKKVMLPDKMSDDHEIIEKQVLHIDSLVKSLPDNDFIGFPGASSRSVKFVLSPTSINKRSASPVNLALSETLAKLHDAITTLQQSMDPHLKEEEKEALPAMHANFTPDELKPVFDKMIGAMEWWALPHFYRQHKVETSEGFADWDRAAIREHATTVLGMPGVVFDMIIFPTFRRYDLEYGWAIEESKNPLHRAHYQNRRRQVATWFRRSRKMLSWMSGRHGVLSGKGTFDRAASSQSFSSEKDLNTSDVAAAASS